MKKPFYLSLILIVAAFCVTTTAFAATKDYLIVKDLPLIGDPAYAGLGGYLKAIFQLGIGIAVTLAIVMLVVNGIQYMFSDIPGVKVSAKNNLGGIIFGLILAFSSWLILYTINPNLVEFDLIASLRDAAGTVASSTPPTGTSTTPTEDGAPWPSDAMERGILGGGATPPVIGVNKANCTTVGQRDCTSVYGLTMPTIEALANLKARCVAAQPGCVIKITGGTEHWAHETHNNNRTVDLSVLDPRLSTYIGGEGNTCGAVRVKDGVRFVWEDNSCSWAGNSGFAPHWHVAF